MRYTLDIARSADVLEQLYAFRYRIYVEEMNRVQKYADHDRRRIEDPLDRTAHNIVAWDTSGDIVGCVRVNFSKDGGLDYYASLLEMTAVGADHPAHTSLCTRMMIAPDHRRTTLATRLCCASFELGLDYDIRWNFIDCNDHLVEFFSRFGYENTHQPVHEEYGQVNALRLNLNDLEHLKSIRSVFAPIAEKFVKDNATRELAAQ